MNQIAEELDAHLETIRTAIKTAIKRGNLDAARAFDKLLINKAELEEYRMRTWGASGAKPTGRPAKAPSALPPAPPRPVCRPRKDR